MLRPGARARVRVRKDAEDDDADEVALHRDRVASGAAGQELGCRPPHRLYARWGRAAHEQLEPLSLGRWQLVRDHEHVDVAPLVEITPRHRPEFSASEHDTYYQIMFESPDRVLFEVVYEGPKA